MSVELARDVRLSIQTGYTFDIDLPFVHHSHLRALRVSFETGSKYEIMFDGSGLTFRHVEEELLQFCDV